MDPISLSLLLGGTGLNLLGGILGQNDALSNATAQANARNAVVASAIGKLNAMEGQNQTTMSNLLSGYSAPAQQQQLANDQATRSASNTNAISAPTPSAVPIQSDASPMSRSDLAKRMLDVHDFAVNRAKAQGTLGGYSDAWLQNELNNAQAGRNIGVVNNAAEGRKALVGPESDLAAAAAYRPPSIWGPLLSGLGSLGIGAGANTLGGSGSSTFGGFNYNNFIPGMSGSDVAGAAKAGVQSGLQFDPLTGAVF